MTTRAIVNVPSGFTEAVIRAKGEADKATAIGDLALLAMESHGRPWETEGLRVVGGAQAQLEAGAAAQDMKPPHAVLFTGHRIDAPDRKTPRFPASKVDAVRQEIEQEIDKIVAEHGTNVIGISGAASGGDILFHEALIARGIPSVVYLALPKEKFAAESVQDAGPDWMRRYDALLEQRPARILQSSEDLPDWLADLKNYSVWSRNNLWILTRGLVYGGANMTLLALWDGKPGDGPGGTEDMVAQATERGARVVRLKALA